MFKSHKKKKMLQTFTVKWGCTLTGKIISKIFTSALLAIISHEIHTRHKPAHKTFDNKRQTKT